ncbi:MAG: hypothetical protein HRT61_03470 [Ekhidna sp.]|nr:hypothetical protein [Ekhidna sp.]
MKRIALLSILSFLLFSCDEEPAACCFEPAGAASYFIANLTSAELKVQFVTSQELGLQLIDTASIISPNTTSKIFEDGIIGVNPEPSNSFSSLSLLQLSDSSELTISPIINEDWEVISKDFEAGEYGLTEYELRITDDEFSE